MSESSLSRTALRPGTAPADADLFRSLAGPLAEWLPRQRWFAGKGRPVSRVELVTATELLPYEEAGHRPGMIHLLLRARQPAAGSERTATPAPGAGPPGHGNEAAQSADCYQLLLGVRDTSSRLPPGAAAALIAHPGEGPLRNRLLYDAVHDAQLMGHLLGMLGSPGRCGPLRFRREPDAAVPRSLPARPLAAEQSNSSVVYGDRYILKLFRRVEAGVNPDLELPLALARHAPRRVPAPTAWFETEPETRGEAGPPATLGVLQPFLPGCSDGWQLALSALAERRDFTAEARALGRATAEVHTGLARALPTCVLGRAELESTAAAMTRRLEAAGRAVPELRPYRPGLREAFRGLAALGGRGHTCPAQRVHGDLHLGQVLAVPGGGWSLIDFEGEPARPLAERRIPQPVVRDIAGMLRSFDYAACQQQSARPGPPDAFARRWADGNREAFCAGYAEAAGRDPREEATLLRAYETDKTVYEVLYEARHRPTWLHVPMSAIRRLAAGPAHP